MNSVKKVSRLCDIPIYPDCCIYIGTSRSSLSVAGLCEDDTGKLCFMDSEAKERGLQEYRRFRNNDRAKEYREARKKELMKRRNKK